MAISPTCVTEPIRAVYNNKKPHPSNDEALQPLPSLPLTFDDGISQNVSLDILVLKVLSLLQNNDNNFMNFMKDELQRKQASLSRFQAQKTAAIDKRARATENLKSGETVKNLASTATFACAGIGSLITGNVPAGIAFLATAGASLDKFFGAQGSALIARCLSRCSGESEAVWENRLRTAATLSAVAMTVVGSFSGIPVLQRVVSVIQASANGYGEHLKMQETDALYEEKLAKVRCDITKMHIEDQMSSIKDLAAQFYDYFKSMTETMSSAHNAVKQAIPQAH